MALVRKLDNSRYVMTAVSNDPDIATVYDELDAIGINYNLDKYDKIHENEEHTRESKKYHREHRKN